MHLFWIGLMMAALAYFQAPVLIREKKWDELAAFGLMWLAATVYAVVSALGLFRTNAADIIFRVTSVINSFLGFG